MTDTNIITLDRDDVIDTSAMSEILFTISTGPARSQNAVPEELMRIVGRLLLGQPVPRADIDRWGMGVMKLMRMPELDLDDPDVRKQHGVTVVGPTDNVVPLKR
jgi:hypothetical protein